jgi:hypothetical protein
MSQISELRQCFLEGLPAESQADHFVPPPEQIYVPSAHRRALSLDAPLVLGGRGAGKTLWLSALKDTPQRKLLAHAFDLPELLSVDVSVGFSTQDAGVSAPDARTLGNLLQKKLEPYDIWSAVILNAFVPRQFSDKKLWSERAQWVANNGEQVSRLLQEAEQDNLRNDKKQLVLFDGLDTTAPRSWEETQSLLRGLLMLAHEFRRYQTLRLKLFLRPDMLAERTSVAFPDSSKLVSNAVGLDWKDNDLYGLLFQYVGNAPGTHGAVFRDFAAQVIGTEWNKAGESYPVPKGLRDDQERQQKLFHALAGKSMGNGAQRGDTWKWVPNHLSDTDAYVSPRSFIAALRNAAEKSSTRDADGKGKTALLWQAIQDGVASASRIRVREMTEDFPWVDDAIKPLKGLAVPCSEDEILKYWKGAGTLAAILKIKEDQLRLPPIDVVENKPQSLIEALKALKIFSTRADGRIDVPDIIRVEAGMPRRGGVPVRR